MGKEDCIRKHPVDQVSRIMHAQHAMKHFLGALGKPAMPQLPTAIAKRHHHKAPARAASMRKNAPPAAHVTVSHTSFRLRISDPRVNVRCTAFAQPHRSSSVSYIHMPTLAKPWIPICPACHRSSSH